MTASALTEAEAAKRAAARRAVREVEDGMVLGLGTCSTAALALEALSLRIRQGLRVSGIPTSVQTAALAERLGIPLTRFAEHRRLDLAIDGADQVERRGLTLIKGLGGALLREKIVAAASRRMVVIVDETKLVDRLGGNKPLPVEIVSFGWQSVLERLAALGGSPQLRLAGAVTFVTDGGNHIADCTFGAITDPAALEARLSSVVGVVESGLFVGLASTVVIGRPSGNVEVIER